MTKNLTTEIETVDFILDNDPSEQAPEIDFITDAQDAEENGIDFILDGDADA